MTLTLTTNPATDSQMSYIASLMDKVYGDNAPEAYLALVESEITRKQASEKIDALRAMLYSTPAQPKPTVTVPDGIHYTDGTVYRIRTSKSGNQYAERLLTQIEREANEGKAWVYEGRKPLAGLSSDTVLTFQQAKAYGKMYGICADCGKLLTNPDSVEAGIGPVCIKKW